METQNEQLEKILKLIQENFEAKKISNKDLNEIIFYSAGLVKVENLGLVQVNKAFNNQLEIDAIEEIPAIEAEKAKNLFVSNFGENPALANKVFRFKTAIILILLENEQDFDVYFSQDETGNLGMILNTGSGFYEITNNSSKQIKPMDRERKLGSFKDNLKTTIETSLKKDYTEFVTIPFKSNFDQFNGKFPQTIVLVPAISVSKYAGRMTLIMNFEDCFGTTCAMVKGVSYDTFTPHP